MAGSTRTSTTGADTASGAPTKATSGEKPQTDAPNPEAATPEKGKKVLRYVAPFNVVRTLSAADLKSIHPTSELGKQTWEEKNNHRVDVSDWPEAVLDAVIESDANFELIEG